MCGESDDSRVKIDNLDSRLSRRRKSSTLPASPVPSVKFLAFGERRATARYLITPGLRYRLMARAPTEDYEQRKDAIDAFFSSFKVLRRLPGDTEGIAMKACVVVFPGSNCDRDIKVALEAVSGKPVHMVWHADAACRPAT